MGFKDDLKALAASRTPDSSATTKEFLQKISFVNNILFPTLFSVQEHYIEGPSEIWLKLQSPLEGVTESDFPNNIYLVWNPDKNSWYNHVQRQNELAKIFKIVYPLTMRQLSPTIFDTESDKKN